MTRPSDTVALLTRAVAALAKAELVTYEPEDREELRRVRIEMKQRAERIESLLRGEA